MINQLIRKAELFADNQIQIENSKLKTNCAVKWRNIFSKKLSELVVKECADAADMAYNARCKYAGDYIIEHMEIATDEGAASWRVKTDIEENK